MWFEWWDIWIVFHLKLAIKWCLASVDEKNNNKKNSTEGDWPILFSHWLCTQAVSGNPHQIFLFLSVTPKEKQTNKTKLDNRSDETTYFENWRLWQQAESLCTGSASCPARYLVVFSGRSSRPLAFSWACRWHGAPDGIGVLLCPPCAPAWKGGQK